MKIICIIILFFLASKYVVGQSSKPDTLKEKYAWIISLGNYAKGGLGTTFLRFGYNPNRYLDFFVAPSWGIFTGGTAIFFGSKFNVFSKRKLLFNAELTYRHSSSTMVNYGHR